MIVAHDVLVAGWVRKRLLDLLGDVGRDVVLFFRGFNPMVDVLLLDRHRSNDVDMAGLRLVDHLCYVIIVRHIGSDGLVDSVRRFDLDRDVLGDRHLHFGSNLNCGWNLRGDSLNDGRGR